MDEQNVFVEERYEDPELSVVELTGVEITADSNVCCSRIGMVGYE